MIKVSNKDSIIDIIKKIENSKEKEVVLEFPIGNSILHSYTSLKILKNKTKEKKLIIITNDLNSKKIVKKLGIKFSIIGDKKVIDNIDLLKYNYTYSEYFVFLIKNYIQEFKNFFLKKTNNSKYNKILNYKYLKNEKSRIGFFISGLVASILLLIFIFYFAVNKTYINITPEIIIKIRAKNFIFKELTNDDILENKKEIKLKKISKYVNITDTFGSSGIYENTKSKSKGKILIINNLKEKISLVKNTRIETLEGITFITQDKIFLPKAKNNLDCTTTQNCQKIIPGTVKVDVIAKFYDNKGVLVGEKGNIKSGIKMYIPGLGKKLIDSVYAKSIVDFKGGKSEYQKIVGENDIDNAKKILEERLKSKALKEIKKQIEQENKTNNITYDILGIDNIIKYSDLKITGDENIKLGDKKDKFILSGKIKIITYLYNKELVINKLKTTIREKLLTDIESINFINDNSLRVFNVISKKEDPLEIKITSEIEVFYTHNFLSKKNNYTEELKSIISGIDKGEALKILINNPKISDAKIETRPFFMKNISKIHKNIIFKINRN